MALDLRCPACRSGVLTGDGPAGCAACGARYPLTEAGQLDLRLPEPRDVTLTVRLGAPPPAVPPISLEPNPRPEVDLGGLELPGTISPRFASYLPRAPRAGARALDLGCGDTRARPLLEHAGYEYVGIDYFEPQATYVGDAHALPFADESFDLVFSIAVLEYLRHPYVAMQEAFRVLRPGGAFVGNAGFLLPFLPDTYFHHTHMGVLSTLGHAGFSVEQLLLDRRWTALEATATISYFPRLPDRLVRAIVAPVKGLHIAWWRLARRFAPRPLTETERVLRVAGDIEFVARRPG